MGQGPGRIQKRFRSSALPEGRRDMIRHVLWYKLRHGLRSGGLLHALGFRKFRRKLRLKLGWRIAPLRTEIEGRGGVLRSPVRRENLGELQFQVEVQKAFGRVHPMHRVGELARRFFRPERRRSRRGRSTGSNLGSGKRRIRRRFQRT